MRFKSVIILAFLFVIGHAHAQKTESFEQHKSVNFVSGATASLDFSTLNGACAANCNKGLVSGVFKVRLDLGEDYSLNQNDFLIQTNVSLEATIDGVAIDYFKSEGYDLAVLSNQPEAYIVVDLKELTEQIDGNDSFIFDNINITVNSITSSSSEIEAFVRLQMSYEVQYGFKVSTLMPILTDIAITGKQANISWMDDPSVSHYQLQLLRLYNLDPAYKVEKQIKTKVNWSRSMTIEIDLANPSSKNYKVTLAEGTGFYAIRIRPVGAYYPGDVGNSQNWGIWSEFLFGSDIILNEGEGNLRYFYYSEAEDNVNWIYSRVFAEGSKVKENVAYADGLLKVKQQQTYLPSKNITLVQQTVYDHVGRPAVSSIPVPISSRQQSYKSDFMRAAGALEVFQAKHFDTEEKLDDPDQLEESGAFGYYHNNSDKSIPNSEGFGYTRTLYYNDGTGRVKEQSGVGKQHSINEDEGGKTTRYMYATPTDDELIALFGDEAPSSESVFKTITIDPNNTTSVSYTSKEGNVIATSLVFTESSDNLLPLDNEEMYEQKVTDYMKSNLKQDGIFVSAKRLSFAVPTDLDVSYSIRCEQIPELCIETTIECNFHLLMKLHKIDHLGNIVQTEDVFESNPNFDAILNSISLSDIPCVATSGEEFKSIAPVTLSLEAGSYILEKILRTAEASGTVAQNEETITLAVNSITDLVGSWLESIETTEHIQAFNQSVYDLAYAANNNQLDQFSNSNSSQFPVNWPAGFTEFYNSIDSKGNPVKNSYFIRIFPDNYDPNSELNPTMMVFDAPCCENIEVPVQWVPDFDCEIEAGDVPLIDANDNGFFEPVNFYEKFKPDPSGAIAEEYFPDFEGYMLAFLSSCIGPDRDFPTEESLINAIYGGVSIGGGTYNYMEGWEVRGTFNTMVYHMLTDAYDMDGVDSDGMSDDPYTCDELLACWTNVLNRLKEEICVKSFDFNNSTDKNRVSDTFDERNGGDGSVHDKHFDEKFKGGFFLTNWIAKRKVSKRMRNLQLGSGGEESIQPELGIFHIVEAFLTCTGQKFAKIITPLDAKPFDVDLDDDFFYTIDNTDPLLSPVPYLFNRMTKLDYFGVGSALPVGFNDKYIPLEDWLPKKRVLDDNMLVIKEPLFPNIKNPIYAYKYYEYPGEGLSEFLPIEQAICYSDPNDCYQLDNNGLIIINSSGKPLKVECCSSNPSPTDPGCFDDYTYPGHAGVKYVVNDFCGIGRIRCPYTKDSWSSGQRLTFYNSLKTYETISSSEDPPIVDLGCMDIATVAKWMVYVGPPEYQDLYELEDILNNLVIDEFTNAFAITNPDASLTVVHNGLMEIRVTDPDPDLTAFTNILLYKQVILKDDIEEFAYYQLEIEQRTSECKNGCKDKEDLFLTRLMALLDQKCYDIGGCRTDDPSTVSVVPEEDIQLIIDQIVASCMDQCVMTTYSCEEVQCRDLRTSQLDIGVTKSSNVLNYGIGGYPSGIQIYGDPEGNTSYSYVDNSTGVCIPASVGGFKVCTYFNADKSVKNLSWYEYTLNKQASAWDFEMDMPSQCEGEVGNRKPEMPYNEPGVNASIGSTFVPKDRYSTDTPPDPNGDEPVISPTKSIHIQVNN